MNKQELTESMFNRPKEEYGDSFAELYNYADVYKIDTEFSYLDNPNSPCIGFWDKNYLIDEEGRIGIKDTVSFHKEGEQVRMVVCRFRFLEDTDKDPTILVPVTDFQHIKYKDDVGSVGDVYMFQLEGVRFGLLHQRRAGYLSEAGIFLTRPGETHNIEHQIKTSRTVIN